MTLKSLLKLQVLSSIINQSTILFLWLSIGEAISLAFGFAEGAELVYFSVRTLGAYLSHFCRGMNAIGFWGCLEL